MKSFIDTKKAELDDNGIWIGRLDNARETQTSKKAWEEIYNFTLDDLYKDKAILKGKKLEDHIKNIEASNKFTNSTYYLEIGCGPAHIGVDLMKKYKLHFIGVDFNYKMLIVLRDFFHKEGLLNYTLIHADITSMPILDGVVDYIYGGGVIEHIADTQKVLLECHRVLRNGGISYNTVPAFNLWWPIRFYRNIPSLPFIRRFFEFIHYKIFNGKILEKNFGYELSFTSNQLHTLHKECGFLSNRVGAFSFHLSIFKNIPWINELIFKLTNNMLLTPIYYISAVKE